MKKLILLVCLAVSIPVIQTGCPTPPSSRVVQVQTLKAVGQTAEAAVALSAQLYQAGTITPAQAYQVNQLYDLKFQPAFKVAVFSVNSNLDSLASPDLIAIAQQISNLVASFQHK